MFGGSQKFDIAILREEAVGGGYTEHAWRSALDEFHKLTFSLHGKESNFLGHLSHIATKEQFTQLIKEAAAAAGRHADGLNGNEALPVERFRNVAEGYLTSLIRRANNQIPFREHLAPAALGVDRLGKDGGHSI